MRSRTFVHFIAVGVLCSPMLASTSLADQTDPVIVESPPTGQGPAFVPGTRLVDDLPTDYIEEEFFISGLADLYNYANDPPEGPTDIEVISEEPVRYKTRIIVRRPAKANKFNGTVVIEWWNSTAGFDTAPAWDPSAEYFANSGTVYVGVTNSTTSLGFLVDGCRLFSFLPKSCGTRYETLSLPANGLAWDVMSQIANLLKSDDVSNPLPVDYAVERVLHVGESQQAGSVITYASGFHLDGLNDGYFVQSGINSRPINFGPACGAEAPEFPDCTPRLSFPASRVRTDLPVPVYQTVTQTDFEGLGFSVFGRQADTSTFRYYEIAGAAHNTVHEGIEIIPADIFGPNPILLTDLCLEQLNTVADGPVFASYVLNALWERMQEQLIDGDEPPAGVLLDTTAEFELVRDDLGNVEGGVRLPSMEAPTATYVSSATPNPYLPPELGGFANLACRLSGAVLPFDDAILSALYPDHGTYVSQVVESANELKSQGLMLQQDAVTVKTAAAASDIGQ